MKDSEGIPVWVVLPFFIADWIWEAWVFRAPLVIFAALGVALWASLTSDSRLLGFGLSLLILSAGTILFVDRRMKSQGWDQPDPLLTPESKY